MMSLRVLIAFAATASMFTCSGDLKGREVRYVAGSFKEIQVGCKGRLDARDRRDLWIACGATNLSISNSTIAIAKLVESTQDVDELTINVPIVHGDKERQLVYIRIARDTRSDWLLLEMPAQYARDVVVLLVRMREAHDAGR